MGFLECEVFQCRKLCLLTIDLKNKIELLQNQMNQKVNSFVLLFQAKQDDNMDVKIPRCSPSKYSMACILDDFNVT